MAMSKSLVTARAVTHMKICLAIIWELEWKISGVPHLCQRRCTSLFIYLRLFFVALLSFHNVYGQTVAVDMVINGKFVKKLLTSVENELFWAAFFSLSNS